MMDIKKVAVPEQSGVYMMKDNTGRIIYIGKAKNLKNRVGSYFSQSQDYKTQRLVERIDDIEFVVTDSEDEAFLLESNLIKQYRPMYNIELKDQQRYTYLKITDEKYPRLTVARRTRDGRFPGRGRVFGPFTQGSSKLLTVGMLRKSFKIRICRTLPKKACLEYHMGNCEAPCEFAGAQERYTGHVEELESILSGRKNMRDYMSELEGQMRAASDALEFERAKEIKETLYRLGGLQSEQKMEHAAGRDEDYFGVRYEGGTALVMSLKQINGVIRDRERFSFDVMADNTFSHFLYQYYSTRDVPGRIVASCDISDRDALERALSRRAGHAVRILTPRRGRRRRMTDLILKNIDLIQSGGAEPGLVRLRDELGLDDVPRIIECFDISNHGDAYAVGAMSRFVDGEPDRSGYRRFRIKTVRGRDDYAMMSEVVRRRYARLDARDLPDLVLIDGGVGQLGAAVRSLEALSLDVPCVSIAKRNEEVFVPGREAPAALRRDEPALSILRHARDESHRFGVSYNRRLRRISPR